MFFGLIVRMYYAPKEHNPPHVHVFYQNTKAVVDLDGQIVDGELSVRHLRMMQAWIEILRRRIAGRLGSMPEWRKTV